MSENLFIKLSKSKVTLFLFLILFSGILFGNFFSLNDPDYFWHYKAGEFITKNKIVPQKDIFSFSMPDFKWVDHEWLSDTLLYNIEKNAGQISLGIFYLSIFSLLVGIIIFSKNKSINFLDCILLFIGFTALSGYIGVRQQVFSFLFFGLLLFLLQKREKKIFWITPVLFLLWANLHGGFAIGLFAMVVFIFVDIIRKKIKPNTILIFLFSAGATFLNPYGFRVYEEIYRTIGDNYLTMHITEWQSIFFNINYQYVIFIAFFVAFLPKLIKKIPLEFAILLSLLFLMSLKSVKYTPFFIVGVLPFLLDVTNDFLTKENMVFMKKVLFSRKAVAVLLFSLVLGYFFFFTGGGTFLKYPNEETVKEIKNDSETKIFNPYGWGGYLIRYAPNKKYFIDGRMPSWKEGDKYVFRDYVDAASCKNTIPILNQYKIKTVLWDTENNVQEEPKFLSSVKKWLPATPEKKDTTDKCDFVKTLEKNGWKLKYQNGNDVILKK